MVGHHRRLMAPRPRPGRVRAAGGVDDRRQSIAGTCQLDLIPARSLRSRVLGERRRVRDAALAEPQLHHLPVTLAPLESEQRLVLVVVEEPVLEPERARPVVPGTTVGDVDEALAAAHRQRVAVLEAAALIQVVARARGLSVRVGGPAQEVEIEARLIASRCGGGDQRLVGTVQRVAAARRDEAADRLHRVRPATLQGVGLEQRPVALQQRGQLAGASRTFPSPIQRGWGGSGARTSIPPALTMPRALAAASASR